jgi:hypothetical protein
MFDHAVLDVAAFSGIVYRGFPDALVHQPSNLPKSEGTESPNRGADSRMPSPGNLSIDGTAPVTNYFPGDTG